jgi:CheY-like chemotaxis protein
LWIKEDKPEMIIADLDMPGMDGYEFVRRLRGFTSFVSVPVLCITGTEATDADILAGGFAAVLRKPTTLSDVMTSIEEVRAGVAPGPAPNS